MIRPRLESTPLGTNTTNRTTSPIDLIPVGTKTLDHTSQTRPTDFSTLPTYLPEQNGKSHVPGDPDPDQSSTNSSAKKYNSSKNTNTSKSIKNKPDKKKKRRKYKKQDASDSFLNDSEYSDDSYYRRKQRKNKSDRKKDPIKLCSRLTSKLLTATYKSKIIRFKLDEDPLQHRIYFLTFVESLEMICFRYKETCEVLLDYPEIGGDNIKEFAKKLLGIFCMQIFMYPAEYLLLSSQWME